MGGKSEKPQGCADSALRYKGHRRKGRGASWDCARASFTSGAYLPHPEQDAQQSAEGQHAALAAFTAPVRPNASTANNRIALMLFMTFSFLE
jgi:hypothetical protein